MREGPPVRLASRPPLARLLTIDAAIGNGSCPTATALALQLEVSPRTIYRDIDLLRDQLHAPLVFDPRRNGYRYTEPNYRCPPSA
jgi:predicted DNA-binding transcriptional regulator YafY